MKRLTEKEIQEKLYGKYHRTGVPPPTETKAEPARPPTPEPQLELFREEGQPKKEPSVPKKAVKKPRPKASVISQKPQPIASHQAKLFVASLLAVGVILLLFSLRPKPASPRLLASIPPPSSSSKQTVSQTLPTLRRFTIQTIVYTKRDQADLLVADLKKKNLEASIEESLSKKGQPRYVVLVGDFATAGEAAYSLETLTLRQPKLFQGSFVRKR